MSMFPIIVNGEMKEKGVGTFSWSIVSLTTGGHKTNLWFAQWTDAIAIFMLVKYLIQGHAIKAVTKLPKCLLLSKYLATRHITKSKRSQEPPKL